MAYIGPTPIPKASLTLTQGTLASSSQTITVAGGYTPGNIFVYINGYRLQTSEYTASDGSVIDLGEVFPAGTDYVVEEVRSFTLPDAYTKAEIQNASFDFVNMPTVGGDPVVESGSNTDGEWTRWADGTQASYSRIYISDFGGNTTTTASMTFPLVFINRPVITGQIIVQTSSSTNASLHFLCILNQTILTTGIQDGIVIRNDSAGSYDTENDIVSIGRWK